MRLPVRFCVCFTYFVFALLFVLAIGTIAERQGRREGYRELYPSRCADAQRIAHLENQVIALGGKLD